MQPTEMAHGDTKDHPENPAPAELGNQPTSPPDPPKQGDSFGGNVTVPDPDPTGGKTPDPADHNPPVPPTQDDKGETPAANAAKPSKRGAIAHARENVPAESADGAAPQVGQAVQIVVDGRTMAGIITQVHGTKYVDIYVLPPKHHDSGADPRHLTSVNQEGSDKDQAEPRWRPIPS